MNHLVAGSWLTLLTDPPPAFAPDRPAPRRQAGPESESATGGVEPAAPAPDHDTALVVRDALAALPAEQRAAIVLVDVQGYPVAEAALILGVAEGTIKSRCARGRARLARSLGHLRPRTTPTATVPAVTPGNPQLSGSVGSGSDGTAGPGTGGTRDEAGSSRRGRQRPARDWVSGGAGRPP